MTTSLTHKKTLAVAMALVFVSLAGFAMLPAHGNLPPPWTVSLDVNSTSATDACFGTGAPCTGTTFTTSKTWNIGAIVNASGAAGACGAQCIQGVFGWQFSIVYDNTTFVPQGDPAASSASDFASNTVTFGAQTAAGNPAGGW